MRINNMSPVNTFSSVNMAQAMDLPQMQTQSVEYSDVVVSTGGDFGGNEYVEETPVVSEELIDKSLEQANKNLARNNRVVERAIHEVTGAIMYTVRDTVTNEVIAEFPPRKIQDMISKMWEFAGLFVDEKA